MTLQIYIPFNGFTPDDCPNPSMMHDAAKKYGEKWLAINDLEGIVTEAGNTLIAEVDRQQIRALCEAYIQEWSTEDLRSYSEFRMKKMISFLGLRLPESRETSLVLEYVDALEDEIMWFLKINGFIPE